jgi:hypothetical protein
MLEYEWRLHMIAIYELHERKMRRLIEENRENYIILLYDHHRQYKEDFCNRLFQKSPPEIDQLNLLVSCNF